MQVRVGCGIGRIVAGNKSIRAPPQRFKTFDDVTNRLDNDFGRERKGRRYCPGGNGAVIRTKWSAAGFVAEELSFYAVHL